MTGEGRSLPSKGEYEVVHRDTSGGLALNVCVECGAVVYALGRHAEWHARMTAPARTSS